nr:MAG TPA: hypothetical protein [Caudoviricetes sp.]
MVVFQPTLNTKYLWNVVVRARVITTCIVCSTGSTSV